MKRRRIKKCLELISSDQQPREEWTRSFTAIRATVARFASISGEFVETLQMKWKSLPVRKTLEMTKEGKNFALASDIDVNMLHRQEEKRSAAPFSQKIIAHQLQSSEDLSSRHYPREEKEEEHWRENKLAKAKEEIEMRWEERIVKFICSSVDSSWPLIVCRWTFSPSLHICGNVMNRDSRFLHWYEHHYLWGQTANHFPLFSLPQTPRKTFINNAGRLSLARFAPELDVNQAERSTD